MKICLSIAGSDCSGGAGIQADIKTFSALGCFGMSVITAVVAENTSRVISIEDMTPAMINDQIDAIFEDIRVDAVKVGMLPNAAAIRATAVKLAEYSPAFTVIDPVMVAKGGHALMEHEALNTLKESILPLAYILTPNIPEAAAITGRSITSADDMKAAARAIHDMGARNVLIKGGHLEGDPIDILFDGELFSVFHSRRIDTKNTHGTGCTLSSAIAAYLALDLPLRDAVEKGIAYVHNAIRYSVDIGKGRGPTNHFFEWKGLRNEKL